MDKTATMNLVRAVIVITLAFVLGIILHYVSKQQEDNLSFVLLGAATIITGTVLWCMSVQPADGRTSFTRPRLGLGVAASLACVIVATLVGYFFKDLGHSVSSLLAVLFLLPMLFWKEG